MNKEENALEELKQEITEKYKIIIIGKEEKTTNSEQLKRNELIEDIIYLVKERLQKDFGEIGTAEIREDILNDLDIKSLAKNIGGDPVLPARCCIINMNNDNKKIQVVINIQERVTPKPNVKIFDKIKKFFGFEKECRHVFETVPLHYEDYSESCHGKCSKCGVVAISENKFK